MGNQRQPALGAARAARPARIRDVARARSLLVGTPREVLSRLVNDDPLDLGAVVARRLAERHLLMDADLVLDASRASCAAEAARWQGVPSIEAWVEERVDGAIDALRGECAREVERGPIPARGPFVELARPLGLSPADMRRGCARFNCLGDEERELFFRLVLERRPPDALARERNRSLAALARPARRALDALLGLECPSGEPSDDPPPAPSAAEE